MKEIKLCCPECGESGGLIVRAVTSYYVDNGEFFCHSVKPQDDNAEVKCLKCLWEGQRRDLFVLDSLFPDER